MGLKVLTTAGAIKQGTVPSTDLANATGILAEANGGTGSAVSIGLTKAVIAASDESLDTSAALQDDNELLFTVVANATYLFDLLLFVTTGASSTPDIKIGWTLPASATYSALYQRLAATATTTTELTMGPLYQSTTPVAGVGAGIIASQNGFYRVTGIIKTAGTAGTAQLQWAQNASDATPTVRKADSFLKYTRVA